jgi:hypothetical protein
MAETLLGEDANLCRGRVIIIRTGSRLCYWT